MWIGIFIIGAGMILVGFIIHQLAQYLLDLRSRYVDLQYRYNAHKLKKKLINVHYKYVRDMYGYNTETWRAHQRVCEHGCNKR